jgi:diguanylate cyclase (GGDEF)-like protein
MIDPPLIIASLRRTTAIALAEIDPSGGLCDANAGFIRLLPEAVGHQGTPDIARYFLSPVFPQLVALSRSGREPSYDGLLTIGDPTGRSRSLRGTVSRCGQLLLLVAEFDIEELEHISDEAIQLSNELAQAQRELLSAHNKLKRREEEIRTLSLTDQLTGIANRRRFDEVIAAEYARARRYGGEFALAMADIDHFKRVNDEFGHDVGDAAIRAFAHVIQGQIRRNDLAARFGGEEFVVLMPEADTECALHCAERIRTRFGQETIPPIPRPVTASFGVTALEPDDTVMSLFKRADDALYKAKGAGRNRVVVA